MSYIGNTPYQVAFVTDTFSGNASTTVFTMSVAPANTSSVLVAISGVLQDPSTYSVSGTTLTFSAAPPSGTGNISARFLGIPASGVTTTAYRTVTEFTATAGQTTFTPPSYTAGFINVYRNGVLLGSADYTATNGTTVVLATGATVSDLVTVESFLVSSVLNAIPGTGGSVSSLYLDIANHTGTGALSLPSGTSSQRPASPVVNMIRYNTTESKYEVYDGSNWVYLGTSAYPYTVEYIVVAGGGGGSSGGGGAGGYLTSSVSVTSGVAYTVTIGGGGTGGSGGSPTNGSNSVFSSYTATGGGYGGRQSVNSSSGSGGSGGGAGRNATGAGSGTAGQGYAGGNGATSGTFDAGGGGGAGAIGTAATSSAAGAGGIGTADTWTGSSRYLAGGGGGSNEGGGTAAAGGTGGGGAGSATTGTAGTTNTGGGGGGGVNLGSYGSGGNGGSGIVVIRYSGSQRGTGGTVTSSGGYTIHTFTTSGTYTA